MPWNKIKHSMLIVSITNKMYRITHIVYMKYFHNSLINKYKNIKNTYRDNHNL